MNGPYITSAQVQYLPQLLEEIARGELQVPRFQRGRVWSDDQRLELLRSVRSGLPIGSVLLWRTRRTDIRRRVQQLGPHLLPAPPSSGNQAYVLDGHQRLSTLFGALHATPGGRPDPDGYDWEIFYNLAAQEFVLRQADQEPATTWLPLSLVMNSVRLLRFQRSLAGLSGADEMIAAGDQLADAVRNYQIPIILIATDNLDLATKIFQRINSLGTQMSEVDMLAARAYRDDFDLREELGSVRERLARWGWQHIADAVLLATCKAALDLPLGSTINVDATADAILARRDLIRGAGESLTDVASFLALRFGIESPALVPHPVQIVVLAEAARQGRLDQYESEHILTGDGANPVPFVAGSAGPMGRGPSTRTGASRRDGDFGGLAVGQHSDRMEEWFWSSTYDPPVLSDRSFAGDLLETALSPQTSLRVRPPPWPLRFDFREPRSKALALLLAGLGPQDLSNRLLPAGVLLAEQGEEALMVLVPPRLLPADLQESPGNRILCRPSDATSLREEILGHIDRCEADFLRSHAISSPAAEAIRQGKPDEFVRLRQEELKDLERRFLQRRGILAEDIRTAQSFPPANGLPPLVEKDGANRWPPQLRPFLEEYLGPPGRPVPFGGRDDELDQLLRWLDDAETLQYRLVVAPAGRGKSALVAHFVKRVMNEGRAVVAFLPLSRRFGTAQRVAAVPLLYGQLRPAQGAQPDPAAMLAEIRDVLSCDFSGDRPLLVVVDALDEADAWHPEEELRLPLLPGQRVKVLLTARASNAEDGSDWVNALGLAARIEPLQLRPLGPAAIAEVLRSLGGPIAEHAASPDLIRELERVSAGDPLVLRYFVEELARGRLKPAALAGQAAGLSAFLERFFGEGPELAATDRLVRNLLAVALGPLSLSDLRVLTRDENLDDERIRRALVALGRLVLGDEREVGFAFAHQSLYEHYRKRLLPSDLGDLRRRFLEYGEEIWHLAEVHQAAPDLRDRVPRYVVRFYGAHLVEASVPEPQKIYDLLSVGWLRAWHAHTDSYDGFLEDVDRAWRVADEKSSATEHAERFAALVAAFRAALLRSSVHSLSSNVPARLLGALVKEGLWPVARALAYARRAPGSLLRVEALTVLAPLLSDSLLPEALNDARRLRRRERAEALAALLPRCREADLPARLDELVDGSYWEWKGPVLRIAPDLSPPLLEQVVAAARRLQNGYERAWALLELVPFLRGTLRLNVIEEAREASRTPGHRECALLLELADQLRDQDRRDVLDRVWEAARREEKPEGRPDVVKELLRREVFLSVATGEAVLAEAKHLVRDTTRDRTGYSLQELSLPLLRRGHLTPEEALALVLARRFQSDRARLLGQLIPYLHGPLQEQALSALRALSDDDSRMLGLDLAARRSPEPLRGVLTDEALNAVEAQVERNHHSGMYQLQPLRGRHALRALSVARRVKTLIWRANDIARLLGDLSGAERDVALVELLGLLRDLPRVEEWSRLLWIATPFLNRDQLVAVAEMAHEIKDEPDQAECLRECAEHLASRAALDRVQEILTLYREWGHPDWLRWTRISVTEKMPEASRPSAAMEALPEALALTDPAVRAHALFRVLRLLPAEKRADVLAQALTSARAVEEIGSRTYWLAQLAACAEPARWKDRIGEIRGLLTTLKDVEDRQERVLRPQIVAALYISLAKAGASEELREEVRAWLQDDGISFQHEWALAEISPYLPEAEVREALPRVRTSSFGSRWVQLVERLAELGHVADARAEIENMDAAHLRALALLGILAHVKDDAEREEVLRQAQHWVKAIDGAMHRALPMALLVRHLSDEERREMMPQALKEILSTSGTDRHEALKQLAPQLAQLPIPDLLPLWQELLRNLARGTRQGLLADLSCLWPILFALGGADLLTGAAWAIRQVGEIRM